MKASRTESKRGTKFKVLSINESANEITILTKLGFQFTLDVDDVEKSLKGEEKNVD